MQADFGQKIADNCYEDDAFAIKNIDKINAQALVQIFEGACGKPVGGFRKSLRKAMLWMQGNGYTPDPAFFEKSTLGFCPYDPKIMRNQNKIIDSWGSDSGACISQLLFEEHIGKGKAHQQGKSMSADLLSGNMGPNDVARIMKRTMHNLVVNEGRRVNMRTRSRNDQKNKGKILYETHGGIGPGVGVRSWQEALINAFSNPRLMSRLMDYLIDQGLGQLHPEAITEVTTIMEHEGNVTRAADALGIDRAGIQGRWRRKYQQFLQDELSRLVNQPPRQYQELSTDMYLKKGAYQKDLEKAIATNEKILNSGQLDDKWKKTLKQHIENMKAALKQHTDKKASTRIALISIDEFSHLLTA